jgi:hypothetical protein
MEYVLPVAHEKTTLTDDLVQGFYVVSSVCGHASRVEPEGQQAEIARRSRVYRQIKCCSFRSAALSDIRIFVFLLLYRSADAGLAMQR